MITIFELNTLK